MCCELCWQIVAAIFAFRSLPGNTPNLPLLSKHDDGVSGTRIVVNFSQSLAMKESQLKMGTTEAAQTLLSRRRTMPRL
eukprot:6472197-Amphidinium_carterae.1